MISSLYLTIITSGVIKLFNHSISQLNCQINYLVIQNYPSQLLYEIFVLNLVS